VSPDNPKLQWSFGPGERRRGALFARPEAGTVTSSFRHLCHRGLGAPPEIADFRSMVESEGTGLTALRLPLGAPQRQLGFFPGNT
jgi:hypothetical protein